MYTFSSAPVASARPLSRVAVMVGVPGYRARAARRGQGGLRMVTTIRAALSALMLLGFYVYALIVVVGLGALSALAIDRAPPAIAGKVVWVTLAVPFAILVATWKVLRAGPPPPFGLLLSEQRAPRLWAQVRGIANAM